jgi:NAD(P)-dependent dehydrogenase (short-subunit alcohol dehydrogenase family)
VTGKVCLVTGATSGIGLATAHELAARGAAVVLVGRTPAKASAAAAAVATHVRKAEVDWLAGDFSDQRQVRAVASEFQRRHPRLDVLLNNAGAIVRRHTLTTDGVELTFAVNHVASFMLTNLLLPVLLRSAPSRVITVASAAHERGRLDFDNLEGRRGYLPFRAYARSKLANVLFSYELARRLDGTGVTSNAADPGLVRTKLGRGNGPARDLAWHLTHLRHREVSRTPEEAAEQLTFLATSPALASTSGAYIAGGKPATSSATSHDRVAADRLWRISEELTGVRGTAVPADASASRPEWTRARAR